MRYFGPRSATLAGHGPCLGREPHGDPDPVPPRPPGDGGPARPADLPPAGRGGRRQRTGRVPRRTAAADAEEPLEAPRRPAVADAVPEGVSPPGTGPLQRARGAADSRSDSPRRAAQP